MDRLSQAPCGFVSTDDNHMILDANEEAARVLGYEGSALVGHSLSSMLSAPTRIFFHVYVYPMLALSQRTEEIHVPLLRRDGESVPVLINAVRRLRDGRFVTDFVFIAMHRRQFVEHELLVAKTVSERSARAEQQAALARVRELQTQLAEQDRLAALGTLTAGVAHEINNPLAYVAGNLEMLVESLQVGAEHVHAAADVDTLLVETLDGVERIRNIVNSLRTLSRADDERRACADLAKVAAIARRLTTCELRERARLDMDIPALPVLVAGNEGRLVQVVVNLLINAAQAFPDKRPGQNVVRLIIRVEGDRAEIEVLDNGPGIPKDIQARVFDPFFSTKPVGIGTGLGLAVCHDIVTSIGGAIALESDATGTSFRVKLPLWKSDAPPEGASSSSHLRDADPDSRIAASMSRTKGI